MSTMNMTTKFESQSLGMAAYKKQKTSLTSNKLWDGYLKLNSALTVSTVAFFHSGEKMPDVKWSESIEVKGKVKLHDFEKYIQELPRSRNKELMVISMYWKEGSSKLALEEMKKVAKKYEDDGRVGIAEVITGIDLYVCPRSDTIITKLAKYGVFKGREAFKENKDSLIGCVVWRRNQINHVNSFHQKSLESSRKKDPILVWSPIRTPFESSRKNDPISVWSPIRTPFESSRKNDPILVWSPIRMPLESSTKDGLVLDISKQRDRIEWDNNESITPQNFRLIGYYSDIVKSEDSPNISQSVCAEVETSNLNTNLLVPDVTTVTKKQSLPSVILQKEPEQDLPKFEIETSATCSETLLEQEMVQDMDISPPESPQKQVCGKHQYDNMSSSTTQFAAAPQWSPYNACWYPPISNIPHSTYVGPRFHPMQTNFIPPSLAAAKINPPFPTHKSDFTYLGPSLMREHAHEYPHPHEYPHQHGHPHQQYQVWKM